MKKLFYMKRHNFIFLVIFIFCIVFIGVMNFVVNPYKLFNHNYKFPYVYDTSCDEQLVYPKMKFNSDKKYDILITGPSVIETCIKEERLKKLFPEYSIYKLVVDAVTVPEQYELVENFIKVHPEVKRIFIAIEFDGMTNPAANRLPRFTGNNLNIKEYCFLLLSAKTSIFSLKSLNCILTYTLIPNFFSFLKEKPFFIKFKFVREYRYSEIRDYSRYPLVRYKDWWDRKLLNYLFVELKKIKLLCEKSNKEVVFYASPLHSNALFDIYYQGVYGELERFKKKFAEITPFYDFLYVCEYTNKPINRKNPYWLNPMHADAALGDLIMKKLILGEGTYGVWVTEENVKSVLKENEKALFEYARKNKEIVKTYITYDHLDFSSDKEIIYHE